MNTNQLKYFIASASNHSFTSAAKQYYISQTAITQQIKALEDQLGVTLFDRSKRPMELTPAGQTFLIEAQAIVERMETAIVKTKEAAVGVIGSLSIGYTKGFERTDLSNALRQFHHDYPNIQLNTYRHSSDILINKLMNDEYDIAYSWDSTNIIKDPAIDSKLVYTSRLMCVLYPSHPLARRKSIKRKELKDEKIIYLSPSNTSNSLGDAYYLNLYKKAGFDPNIIFHTSDGESVLMMVACEEGISILPDYYTDKLDNADNLVFVPLEGNDEILPIHALWKKGNPNSALKIYLDNIK